MQKGSEALVETLVQQGVEHLFGVCGDTSIDLYRTLAQEDRLEHVLSRDERHAAYMADAYARLSDKPGVCEGPSGGGATYLIPGLAESNGSSVPVIGLNTTIPVKYRDRGVLTDVDQVDLFAPVTKWNTSVDHPDLIPRMVRQAFKHTTTDRPGATHLSFPMDVLNQETDEDTYGDEASSTCPAFRQEPDPSHIAEAVERIESSEAPVIVVGGGIHTSGAWTELRNFAEAAGIPVGHTLTSAGAIGDSPYNIGVVGENGFRAYANEMLVEADLVILCGTAVESVWTGKWSRPGEGDTSFIHIDVDAASIGKNYRADVAIPADLRTTIEALDATIDADPKWAVAEISARHEEWVAEYEAEYDSDEFPLRPERLVNGIAELADDDTVFVADAGTATPYFAALYPFAEPGCHWVTNRAHGALGYSLPAAVGAHFARPDSRIVALSGDGSFGIAAGELETYARLDLPITLVVVNNEAFSWIEAGQQSYDGFSFGVHFNDLDYAGIGESFGLEGFRVTSADEFESVMAAALAVDGPSVVDVPTRDLASIDNVPVDWLEPDE